MNESDFHFPHRMIQRQTIGTHADNKKRNQQKINNMASYQMEQFVRKWLI